MQTKLLTVLEQRIIKRIGSDKTNPIDIRLISATNQPMYTRWWNREGFGRICFTA